MPAKSLLQPSEKRSTWRAALAAVALGSACALGLAGCYLNVPWTVPASPALIGTYWRSDGTPAAGMRIAVTTRDRDSTCARAAERTSTDSSGTFRLPATQISRRGILLFPAFDHLGERYRVCAGIADSLLRTVYDGFLRTEQVRRGPVTETLACLDWSWQGRVSVSCAIRGDSTFVTGGHWSAGGTVGTYRVILITEIDSKGPDDTNTRPRLIVQWMQPSATGSGDTVRATVALPSEDRARRLQALRQPQLWNWGERWCLSVDSFRSTWADSYLPEHLVFELGPPGEVRSGDSCVVRSNPS